jgi:hypothetical protein
VHRYVVVWDNIHYVFRKDIGELRIKVGLYSLNAFDP